jgi:hypothetical protein
MRFLCCCCGAELSNPVVVLNDARLLVASDGVDRLPDGFAHDEGSTEDAPVAKWCINIRDAMNMRHTEQYGRLNGCCGLDGQDGPNLVCEKCGDDVATEYSDCWMSHCIVFDPGKTRIAE